MEGSLSFTMYYTRIWTCIVNCICIISKIPFRTEILNSHPFVKNLSFVVYCYYFLFFTI